MRLARVLVLASLAASACTHKLSPSELAADLTARGAHVETKEASGTVDACPGSELSVDLTIDYEEEYKAIRFPSPDLARACCLTMNMGVRHSGWCIYPGRAAPKMDTWHKVEALGQ